MKLITKLDDISEDLRHGALSVGNFDGVHRGHARLVERLVAMARHVDGPAVVLTFDPHPMRVLRPEIVSPFLTCPGRKADLLLRLGIQAMIACPTDKELLRLSPQEFFHWIVVEKLKARAVVEGPNFFFGKDRQGDIHLLRQLCDQAGIQLEVVEPLQSGDGFISSSWIRELIRGGDVAAAREMLTEPYRVRGMVTHGKGRGVKMGTATANLEAADTLLPAQGVYAGRGYTSAGNHPAAISIGPNPTFNEQLFKLEVHLIGFEGSLYGQTLEVDFLARLRDIQAFESVDQLKQQVAYDISRTLAIDREA